MPGAAADRGGVLLERAYRLALLLDGACRDTRDEAAFERAVLSGELLALLDDARAACVSAERRTEEGPGGERSAVQSRSAPA